MSAQQYGHGNILNLAGFNDMAKFMRETSADYLPPITRYALSSARIDGSEIIRATEANIPPLFYAEAFPNEGDKYDPVFGLAVTLNHLFPLAEGDSEEIYDELDRITQVLGKRDVRAYVFMHTPSGGKLPQLATFIPYTVVKPVNEGGDRTIVEGCPKQIDTLLDVLLEQGILKANNPVHRVMIEDCFSLRTRTNSLYLEP